MVLQCRCGAGGVECRGRSVGGDWRQASSSLLATLHAPFSRHMAGNEMVGGTNVKLFCGCVEMRTWPLASLAARQPHRRMG